MRRMVAVLLAGLLIGTGAVAWGYWSAGSGTGGNGAAAASSVNQGATPTVSAAGSAVTVSWTASTLSTGGAVAGYLVTRYDTATLTPQTILSACTGTITALSCVESSVPNGSWEYTVTPVFAANWRGVESDKSATVSIDGTAPTNAITLSSVSGGAFLSGTTVYYRGVAAGSLRLTNAVADAGSGPASSQTAALTGTSTGWTHTPSTVSTPSGGPYVSNTFSWSAATTSSPGEAVTGRDVGGNTAVTNLSFVNDSTAPTGNTVTYANGYSPGRSVSVSFTAGSDSASGIATRRLQRSLAPLSGDVCGTFGAFNDIGTDTPVSPYVDSALAQGCYMYRYAVTDRVGNQDLATSANVVKVSYGSAVASTTGLLSHWRLGEGSASLTSSDSFAGGSGSSLTSHTGEIGATWTHADGSANAVISDANRVRRGVGGVFQSSYTIDYTTATPPSANYSVEADLLVKSNMAGDMVGVIGRMNTATNTFYMARWEAADTSWNLVAYTNGTVGYLNYLAGQPALTVNEAYRIRLEMTGTTLNLYVNGVLKVSATDASLTAAGKAGIMDGDNSESDLAPDKSNTTGLHIDDFQVTPSTYPRAADNKGTNTGDYKNGVTLGVTGALSGATNTAAQFDGVNDYVQMTGTTGIPVGANSRSVEAWFKTSSSARQVIFQYGSRANTQEFGLWIDAGGATMQAWGFGGGNDKVFTMPAAVNNGAWHQVVLTYNGTTLTLYIDGVALATQAATRATVMDAYGFGIGAIINPSDGNSGGFFNGTIDEVSFYTTVLSQATVTDHFQLASAPPVDTSGPTGGSVDASGLVGTGSRYAPSTTLSLVLAKGTDPSGVAATGNTLLGATATLTNGNCGSFGTYTLVTGGTDPVSPETEIVADQACYSYRYVVLDTLGNSTTYTSSAIKVDTTAPSAPTLAFSAYTNTWWTGTGSTVYYRSGAATGSFTATAAATDAVAGIASYAFPSLGTNWTSTPGALGVNTYSWSGAPAGPGTRNVAAANNAGLVSGNAPFTPTADDAAPTAGSVSYVDGDTMGTSVTVTFAAGTDGGSGIGTRLLQRASATRTNGICGSYGGFTTVAGGTNPTSPLVDTVVRGNCYKYQYVVADNVANTHTATSANVAYSAFGAHYALDAGSGTTAVDSSGNANTGTLQAGATWTSGRIGPNAVNLTGAANSFVDVTPAVIDSSRSYSVAAWVKPNNLTGFQTIASIDGTAISPFYLQMSAGVFQFTARSSDSTLSTPTTVTGGTATVGTWTHLVAVHDNVANTISLYKNGTLQSTTAFNSPWQATGHTVIGRAKWNGAPVDFVNGAIDDVRFFDKVLTGSEVSGLAGDVVGPTGGSVDASGLVGTGSRYAASTTLSLDLAKGTDPSGVATTGNLLKRATATLTSGGTANGTCGSFGSYTTVTGGTDPTSPKSDTVADQACYSYRYVVQDTLGNPTTYTSPDIKVDLTAPAAPTLAHSAFTNTYWSSGSTVYYRSAASSGSFTTTSTATDTKSGIASHSFPTLGTNWTSTPGALGVNTYSWSGAPAVPGAKNVTATNHATVTSANASFTPTADDTAPSAGTITYADTTQTSTSVSVSFTTGTDGGSGIGTRLLQRASATLTGSTCGSYGAFATVSGGTNPASPLVDTVTSGSCFTYRYVVADNVANTHTATSANVVKVTSSYEASVSATSGLLGYWRLGEGSAASPMADSFGTNHGTYFTTPTVGVAGAIVGDANTAVQFNGTSQYATVARQISGDLSIEFWFKSTQDFSNDFGQPHCSAWWQGAALVDADSGGPANDFGISLCSGKLIAGVGSAEVNMVTAATYNNGAWHHVVLTRTQSSGALVLYVDGASVASVTGPTVALTTTPTVNIGRSTAGVNYFAGTMDELAFYTASLSPATVSAHYAAAQ